MAQIVRLRRVSPAALRTLSNARFRVVLGQGEGSGTSVLPGAAAEAARHLVESVIGRPALAPPE